MERKQQEELYGKTAQEWLERWDNGKTVWSIEMGGLGPGYEQAIQITVAEVLRILLKNGFDFTKWEESKNWKADLEIIEKEGFENSVINELGLSGAQWGAAVQVASYLYKHNPVIMMNDEKVKDRHIQISKNFPI